MGMFDDVLKPKRGMFDDVLKPEPAPESQIDLNAPVGSEGFLGGLAEAGRGLAHGVLVDFPQQIGQSAQNLGRETGVGPISRWGQDVVDAAKAREEQYPSLKQSIVGQREAQNPLSVRGGAYQAGSNTPLSLGPGLAGAAAGAGLGAMLGGGVGAIPGAAAGYVVGSLGALPLFYGSQGQQSYEKVKEARLKAGDTPEQAEQAATTAGRISGGIEAGGELAADLIPFHQLLSPFAKPIKGALVASLFKGGAKKALLNLGEQELAETSTEMAQQAGETATEHAYGGEGTEPASWKDTLSVLMPTALMTLVPGGLVTAHNFRTQHNFKQALTDGEADPERRTAAAATVFNSIKEQDPNVARAFDAYAARQIADGEPIDINQDDAFYLERAQPAPPTLGLPAPGQVAIRAGEGAPEENTPEAIAALANAEGIQRARDAEEQRREAAMYEAQRGELPGYDVTELTPAQIDYARAQRQLEGQPEPQAPSPTPTYPVTEGGPIENIDYVAATRRLYEAQNPISAAAQTAIATGAAANAAANRQTAIDEGTHAANQEQAKAEAEPGAEPAAVAPPPVQPITGALFPFKTAEAAQARAALVGEQTGQEHQVVPHPAVHNAFAVVPQVDKSSNLQGGSVDKTPETQGESNGEAAAPTQNVQLPAAPAAEGGATNAAQTPGAVGAGENVGSHPANVARAPEGTGTVTTETTKAPGTVDQAAHKAASSPQNGKPEPTRPQIEAGNYEKGHIKVHGLDISVENPEGSTRTGYDRGKVGDLTRLAAEMADTDPMKAPLEVAREALRKGDIEGAKGALKLAGEAGAKSGRAWAKAKMQEAADSMWSTPMQAHYGYIRGTIGRDKDHIDAFVKPGTKEDHAGPIFVIDQVGTPKKKYEPGTAPFDEHKVMIGYDSAAEAAQAYQAHYPSSHLIGPFTKTTPEEFKAWLASGNTNAPFAVPGKPSQWQARQLGSAYSVHLIGEAKKGKLPVVRSIEFEGKLYTNMGGASQGPRELEQHLYPLLPPGSLPVPKPHKPGEGGGFTYTGMRVTSGGKEYQLGAERTITYGRVERVPERGEKRYDFERTFPRAVPDSPLKGEAVGKAWHHYVRDELIGLLDGISLGERMLSGEFAPARGKLDEKKQQEIRDAIARDRDLYDAKLDEYASAFGPEAADQFQEYVEAERERSIAENQRPAASAEKPGLARMQAAKAAREATEPSVEHPLTFSSGMSRPGDFTKALAANHSIGIEIGELSQASIPKIAAALQQSTASLFVDTGAFSLFRANLRSKFGELFPGSGKGLDFAAIFDKYEALGRAISAADEDNGGAAVDRVYWVMPDIVGNQTASLDLLREHQKDVRGHIDFANAIVPLQVGELSLSQAYDEAAKIIGRGGFIVGIPSNEKAVSNEQFREFIEARGDQIGGVHLLGAASEKKASPRLEVLREAKFDGHVSADANRLRSLMYGSTDRATALRRLLGEEPMPEKKPGQRSEKQLARDAQLRRMAAGRKNINERKDSLLAAVIKLGGIKSSYRNDIVGEKKGRNPSVPFVGYLFNDKPSAKGVDEMATLLDQYGYMTRDEMDDVDGGVQALKDKLRDEVFGHPHYSYAYDRVAAMAEQKPEPTLGELDAAAKEELAAPVAEQYGVDVSDAMEAFDAMPTEITADAAVEAFDAAAYLTQEGIPDADQEAILERAGIRADNGEDYETAVKDERSAFGRSHQSGGQGAVPQAQAVAPAEPLELTSQSKTQALTELRKREAEAEAKAKQENAPPPESFLLSGSERPADELAARGQSGLFEQTPRNVAPAPAVGQVGQAEVAQPAAGPYTLEEHPAIAKRIVEGDIKADELRAQAQRLIDSKAAVIAQLNRRTLKDLAPNGTRGATKDKVVVSVYERMLQRFIPGGSMTWSPFSETFEAAVKRHIADVTDEQVQQAAAERRAHLDAQRKALENPETLDEFRTFVNVRGEAALTPEQRARYDDLTATQTREIRARDMERRTQVQGAGVTVGAEIVETKHTQKGHDLFVVQLAQRVERDAYNALNAAAKKLGGYYSSFKGHGAVPGFQFKTLEAAEAFKKLATENDTGTATEVAKEQRAERMGVRESAAVTKLREMAERMASAAEASLNADRQTNTVRRARMAGSAEDSARRELQIAETLRNIANAIEGGEAKHLLGLRNKTQLETLETMLTNARQAEINAKHPTGTDWDKAMREPATPATPEYAKYPQYDFQRADLLQMGNRFEKEAGFKLLGGRLLRLAQSTTDEWVRGVDPKLAEDVLDAVGRYNAGVGAALKLTPGWFLGETHARRQRLAQMGITNDVELRAALRELTDIRAARREADKAKQLERALVGTKAGIDFFPTPPALAQRMVEEAGIKPGMRVLEPSAGNGNIAEAIADAGVDPDVVEISSGLREILEAKGFNVVGQDFMQLAPRRGATFGDVFRAPSGAEGVMRGQGGMGSDRVRLEDENGKVLGYFNRSELTPVEQRGAGALYDRIVMNPPFSNSQDIEHVQHAFSLLKPGGRLVAIMGEGAFFREDAKARAFRDWLGQVGGTEEKLPPGTFNDPTLLASTGANARLVVVDKARPGAITFSVDAPEDAAQRRTQAIPRGAPAIAVARNTKALKASHDYAAAKAGDIAAGVRLVASLVPESEVTRAAQAFGADAIYVYPHAEEAAGRNTIPGALANRLAVETGGSVAAPIVQTNRAFHTGADAMQRLIARPRFDGPVVPGGRYVLVDDVSTMGGTLAELANHIQAGGGKVVGTFLLTDASRTPTMQASAQQIAEIERRYGEAVRETFHIEPAALTSAEAGYLLGFRDADTLRNRAASAARARAERLRAKGVSPEGEVGFDASAVTAPAQLAQPLTDEESEAAVAALRQALVRAGLNHGRDIGTADIRSVPLPDDSTLRALAAAFGQRVVGFAVDTEHLDFRARGVTVEAIPGVLFLNAANPRPHLTTLGHELTHNLRRESEELYQELAAAVMAHVNADLYRAEWEKRRSGLWAGLNDDKLREEFVADAVGDGFLHNSFWQAVSRRSPTLFDRVVNLLGRLIDRARVAFRGLNPWRTREYFADFDAAMRAAGTVFAKYRAGEQAATNDLAFQAGQRSVSPWYSALERAVIDAAPFAKNGSIEAGQLRAWLAARAKDGTVKQAEIEWSGINDWLETQRGRVTRDDVAAFLRDYGVKIDEKLLGGTLDRDSIRRVVNEDLSNYGYRVEEALDAMDGEAPLVYRMTGELVGEDERLPAGVTALIQRWINADNTANDTGTKYASYALPGGENYRELLLTLPPRGELGAVLRTRQMIFESYRARLNEANDRAIDFNLTQGQRDAWRHEYENLVDRRDAEAAAAAREIEPGEMFHSSHFGDESPNILAHVRFNERTDGEGKRVLFIEEIQSDWAQKGRRDGFAVQIGPDTPLTAKLWDNGIAWEVNTSDGRFVTNVVPSDIPNRSDEWSITADEAIAEARRRLRDQPSATGLAHTVPMAPFVQDTKAWTALALKRMIRWAADNGFDRIAWTTGEQQAARYDLSKQVNSIIYFKNADGTYAMSALRGGEGILMGRAIAADKIEDHVGKEIAKKILAGEGRDTEVAGGGPHWQELSGIDLKVGGEGMRAFYDQIVPQVARDIIKRYGGKVEPIAIGKPDVAVVKMGDEWGVVADNYVHRTFATREAADALAEIMREERAKDGKEIGKQVGFDITPALRAATESGMPLFSIDTDGVAGAATQYVLDTFNTGRSFNLFHRTVGTQFHKAQINPYFRPVFQATQRYLADVSAFANAAADHVGELLPRLRSFAEVFQRGPKQADVQRIASAIFQATLDDHRLTAGELAGRGFTPEQITLYEHARAALDASLDQINASELYRLGTGEGINAALAQAKDDPEHALAILTGALEDQAATASEKVAKRKRSLIEQMQGQQEKVEKLKAEGYAPLMRWGRYTVDVVQTVDGKPERVYFGMFESARDANRMQREMQEQYPDANVTRGVMDDESWKLFDGLSLDSLEAFANATGLSEKQAYQDYYKLAASSRSALKRLIHRKGIAGYDPDLPRVLAAFLTSNARLASKNYHYGEMLQHALAIPNAMGDVRAEAAKLVHYVQHPIEEASALRGFLFVNFLGGSVASALTNATQPVMMTLPYLSQFGGPASAAAALAHAGGVAAGGVISDPELRAAMKRAATEGITEPQELHQLYAESIRSLGSSLPVRRALRVWGSLFSLAESFNRRITFAAAFRLAQEHGLERINAVRGARGLSTFATAFDFAENAVEDTQGIYNRGNRPDWARGPIGATVFTFKQFSIAYLEFFKRLPPREKALAGALLILAAGLQGAPGADDMEDIIDTIGQLLGYNTNSQEALRRWAVDTLGAEFGGLLTHGVSGIPGVPIDVSARMGFNNIVPGTGLFKRSETDKSQEVTQVFGPTGGFLQQLAGGFTALEAGQYRQAILQAAPKAVADAIRGADMWSAGQYTDLRGRKVIETTPADALVKMIGIQPQDVAFAQRKASDVRQDVSMVTTVEAGIADKWARAILDHDPDGVRAAVAELYAWNQRNPTWPIAITPYQIRQRVQQAMMERSLRQTKGAPKEVRARVMEALR